MLSRIHLVTQTFYTFPPELRWDPSRMGIRKTKFFFPFKTILGLGTFNLLSSVTATSAVDASWAKNSTTIIQTNNSFIVNSIIAIIMLSSCNPKAHMNHCLRCFHVVHYENWQHFEHIKFRILYLTTKKWTVCFVYVCLFSFLLCFGFHWLQRLCYDPSKSKWKTFWTFSRCAKG